MIWGRKASEAELSFVLGVIVVGRFVQVGLIVFAVYIIAFGI